MKQNISNKRHKAFNFGLGKEESELTLYYDKEGSGLASLTKRDLSFF